MNIKRLATTRGVAVAAVVLAVTLGAGAAVAATSGVFDPKEEQEAFQTAVAKKLGVTTDELQKAYKEAALERLDAAVAAGRITEEQAAAMRERIESGDFPGPFFGGPGMDRGMHGHGLHLGLHLSGAAEYLGLTEAELHERLRDGQSLAQIARAEGKSVDGLEQALLDDAKEKLAQAVENGRITDAQRDEMLQRLESSIDDMVNRTPGERPAFGHRFGAGLPDA